MKIISKILFIYSALIIFVLIATTAISSKSGSDLIKVIPLLPIGIFFAFSIIGKLRPPKSPQIEINKPSVIEVVLIVLVFAFLTFLGINNIIKTNQNDKISNIPTLTTETVSTEEINTSSPSATIIASQSAQIYSQSSEKSKVIKTAKTDEKFEIITKQDDWYQVKINESTESGWINNKYTK